MKRGMLIYVCFISVLMGCTVPSTYEPAEQGVELVPVDVTPVPSMQGKASIQADLGDGPGITALMNKNYNEDTTACTEYGTGKARGYYFCTGILLRTTDDGAFNPWEPSPTALQLRATSYSWIRHDLNTTAFYKRAGYILLDPADAIAKTVPGITYPVYSTTRNPLIECIYPFDAYTTRTMNRNYLGCDFESTGLGSPNIGYAWGSCDNKLGYSTAAQWNQHFQSAGQVNYKQCSWSADNTQGWRNAIASHNAFPGQSSWNEVMLFNGGPEGAGNATWNENTRKWTVAFFYDVAKAGGLADAQSFQRKMAATGKRAPILRINFTAAAASRFQFVSADQVVYP
ncbi:hypothetical protein QN386_12755 [Pseudomonas sp. CCI3.2]|uniref:hypothetical protein n=1 Tax=unclassified Pseudomonas TaxID=196821 RepID=UPI002AC8E629|nr:MULTISPECIES: hypothetical protein [unclassified Pseudomonas]MEB0078132.1 hypothetical protein [Pseudomonas sp. MH10out]MEB0094452.1 hypothetical protein [Pseudomonas sp. CCI4.2]MEB0102186.1 hypothetical protein [Pseudomonas sp. CCI3.2]MEB0132331.1 hypothetical protein [Pseudomonas sp. CCI2.4]MEB0158975.1 hypothetical protein [Pseudomonas sp. AH2 (2023)]